MILKMYASDEPLDEANHDPEVRDICLNRFGLLQSMGAHQISVSTVCPQTYSTHYRESQLEKSSRTAQVL